MDTSLEALILLIVIIAICYLLVALTSDIEENENFAPILYGWNQPARFTKNESYDLRGDPFVMPYVPVSPWNNSNFV